jgi:beta-lactamase class A
MAMHGAAKTQKVIMKYFLLTIIITLFSFNVLANDNIQSQFTEQIRALEHKNGGRIGIAALDTETNSYLQYRGDERFALCSTFKLLLAAAVLSNVDSGKESLQREISYSTEDIQKYAPITKKYLAAGKMTINDLSAAIIQYSDNTAANLLFRIIGGPEGLTNYIRSLGDKTTRIDRIEPYLNSNIALDERDTTTPYAILLTMQELLIKDALSLSSKEKLLDWLIGNTTGNTKIRAGINPNWTVGDKTGAGANGASNDIAIIWPINRKPLLLAIYYTDSSLPNEDKDAVIAEVSRIISSKFYSQSNIVKP